MKKLALTVSIALAQLLAVSAFAQTKGGEADPAGAKAAPAAKPTADEKSAGKATRKEEGAKAAKDAKTQEGNPKPAAAAKPTREERKAASAKRKAEASAAVKAGETSKPGEAAAAAAPAAKK